MLVVSTVVVSIVDHFYYNVISVGLIHNSFSPQAIKEGKKDTRTTSDTKQITSQVHLQKRNNSKSF